MRPVRLFKCNSNLNIYDIVRRPYDCRKTSVRLPYDVRTRNRRLADILTRHYGDRTVDRTISLLHTSKTSKDDYRMIVLPPYDAIVSFDGPRI